MRETLKTTLFRQFILICMLIVLPIHAAEEKKAKENLTKEVAEMPAPELSKPDREQEISLLIEKNLHSGEAVWLGNADKKFLALYKENTWKETQGAILLLHDLGANANWPQLIRPLRLAFPKKGWHTLSLQLPMVMPDEEKESYLSRFDEAVSRINAGIEFLKQKNISNIVIVGHGMGAVIGIFYVNQNPQAPVTALVAISLPGENTLRPQTKPGSADKIQAPDNDTTNDKKKSDKKSPLNDTHGKQEVPPERNLYAEMEEIKIPFLDVYAQVDHEDVVREALKRSELMKKTDNQAYTQWQVTGADHYFRGVVERFIKHLRGWLKKHASGIEISSPSS